MCFWCIKETCRYTLRYSMVMNNYLLDNSNGENLKVYWSIKIGTWYNSAFIRGFFSNPHKSLVRFWSLQSSFEEYIVGSWLPPNILVKAIFATWLTNTLSHFEKMNAKWFLIGVDSFVCIQCTWLFAFVFTLFAAEWLITSVGSYMHLRLPDVEHL